MSTFAEKMEELHQKRVDEYMSHVNEKIKERHTKGTPISYDEWLSLFPMNSYDRELLEPLLDDDAYLKMVAQFFKSSGEMKEKHEFDRPSSTYTDHVLTSIVFQLRRRFEKAMANLLSAQTEIEEITQLSIEQAMR